MPTNSARSLTRRLALIGLVTAMGLSPSGPISHGIQQIERNGSASCLDVPVSTLIIHPTNCWMRGPTSIVVAGTDARSGKIVEMVVEASLQRPVGELAYHARSGPLPNSQLASGAAGDPPATLSFYVYGSYIDVCGLSATTECPLYYAAANEAVPPTGGMTILDFGAPCFEPATLAWGTQLFNSKSCTPDTTLVILAQAWLRGYETNPNRSASPSYVLVAGTSNSLTAAVPGYALTPAEMSLHGQAWFGSVISPIAAVARSLPTPVATWAGNDIEESSDGSWYDGPTTGAWVDAYAATSGASKPCVASRDALMVDYGDYVPNEPGWSAGAVYHVAWQAPPACPVPEIYITVMASEWQSVNLYAESAGLPPMQFTGVLSEDGAAGTVSGSASWTTLRSATGQAAAYLSVIGVTGPVSPEVPDPPAAVTAVLGPGLPTVSWSAPAWDGGSAVTSYTVTVYKESTIAQVVTVSGWPTAETAFVGGLVKGASYTFYVSATNQVGTGPQSLPSRSVTPTGLFLRR
ncbi:MAG TPA: fibronectin type III domain-containing protein [Chloroflexota bacterium]|nr:fibronectin type III domain-containing protein [Chloroflexota bacterium]